MFVDKIRGHMIQLAKTSEPCKVGPRLFFCCDHAAKRHVQKKDEMFKAYALTIP